LRQTSAFIPQIDNLFFTEEKYHPRKSYIPPIFDTPIYIWTINHTIVV